MNIHKKMLFPRSLLQVQDTETHFRDMEEQMIIWSINVGQSMVYVGRNILW